jgi:hypothetical protein
MEQNSRLTLQDIGGIIFRIIQRYLFRKDKDLGMDVTNQYGPLQEILTLRLLDGTRLIVKTFPHKNFSKQLVYRIEVYKTREGDMRGNKIAFMEASSKDDSIDEVHRFVQSFLAQLGY